MPHDLGATVASAQLTSAVLKGQLALDALRKDAPPLPAQREPEPANASPTGQAPNDPHDGPRTGAGGVVDFRGLKVTVDRPRGTVQKGVGADGKEWVRAYHIDYGHIEGTRGGDEHDPARGKDGQLDVYLGAYKDADEVHWILQKKEDGTFDEYKCMVGFVDADSAKAMYLAHTPKRFFGSMASTSVEMMKALLGMRPQETLKVLKGLSAAQEGMPIDKAPSRSGKLPPINPAPASGQPNRAPRKPNAFHGKPEKVTFGTLARTATARANASGHPADHAAAEAAHRLAAKHTSGNEAEYHHDMASSHGKKAKGGSTGGGGGSGSGNTHRDNRGRFKSLLGVIEAVLEETEEPTSAEVEFVERTVAVKVAKDEGEQRWLLGYVLVPGVPDAQGDVYNADEVRKASWGYMARHQNIGLMHKGLVNGKVLLTDNFVAPCKMVVNGSEIPEGAWMMGLNVVDDGLWADVKAGKLTGLSIGGFAKRVPVDGTK